MPAGAQGRLQFHPPGDADHRRQAIAGGAGEYLGLCLLRLDHRHHRRGRAGCRQSGRSGQAHQAPQQASGLCRLRRAHRRASARVCRSRRRRRGRLGSGRDRAPASAPTARRQPKRSPPSPVSCARWPTACAARTALRRRVSAKLPVRRCPIGFGQLPRLAKNGSRAALVSSQRAANACRLRTVFDRVQKSCAAASYGRRNAQTK